MSENRAVGSRVAAQLGLEASAQLDFGAVAAFAPVVHEDEVGIFMKSIINRKFDLYRAGGIAYGGARGTTRHQDVGFCGVQIAFFSAGSRSSSPGRLRFH